MTERFVKVRGHLRKFNDMRKGSGKVLEIPSIAPEKGAKIIDAKQPVEQIGRGVTRVGGGDHGKIDKGVKRLGR